MWEIEGGRVGACRSRNIVGHMSRPKAERTMLLDHGHGWRERERERTVDDIVSLNLYCSFPLRWCRPDMGSSSLMARQIPSLLVPQLFLLWLHPPHVSFDLIAHVRCLRSSPTSPFPFQEPEINHLHILLSSSSCCPVILPNFLLLKKVCFQNGLVHHSVSPSVFPSLLGIDPAKFGSDPEGLLLLVSGSRWLPYLTLLDCLPFFFSIFAWRKQCFGS